MNEIKGESSDADLALNVIAQRKAQVSATNSDAEIMRRAKAIITWQRTNEISSPVTTWAERIVEILNEKVAGVHSSAGNSSDVRGMGADDGRGGVVQDDNLAMGGDES